MTKEVAVEGRERAARAEESEKKEGAQVEGGKVKKWAATSRRGMHP